MKPAAAGLRRAMGLRHAVAMVVGTIIGASIFVQPSEITGRVPSVAGVFAVWGLAGLLTLFGSLVCAELSASYPRSGGVYVFLRESYGPLAGFLWGWAMFWTMHTGIIAAIAMVFARYTAYFTPLGDGATKLVAIGVVLVLSAVNYRGVRGGATLQATITAGKLLAILLIIAAGFALGPGTPAQSPAALPPATPSGFLLALVAGLFAYGGWHMVTYTAEETREPERTLPRALVLGVVIVTLSYMAMNAVYLYVLPLQTVATSTRIAADAADAVLGRGGGTLMSGLVMFSTFGALSGIVLMGPRVYWAMANDGLAFRWLSRIHERYRTPHVAIVAQAVWASALIATGTYRALFTRVVYTEWIFFGLMALGLIRLRRRAGTTGPYRVPGYPYIPAAFALAAFAIVANQVVAEPRESLTGLGFVGVGAPIYYLWARNRAASAS